jgi:hypothetical protein
MHGPFIDEQAPKLAGPAMAGMTEYRIYKIDGDGRIVDPALRVRRASDEAVIATVRRIDGAQAFDIWDVSRRVATVPAHGESAVNDPFYF